MTTIEKIKTLMIRLLGAQNAVSRNAVRLRRAYKMLITMHKGKKMLEICGGKKPLSNTFINVDILDYPTVDVVADILKPLPFETHSIDRIVSVATLEHFNVEDLKTILKEFYRLLKHDGVLEIGVPSLTNIFHYYQEHGCDDLVLRYLHGGLKDEHDIHLCILDFKRFKALMEEAGFGNIEQVDYDFPRHDKAFMMKIRAYV